MHTGAVGRRRGKRGTGYSPTTLEGYARSLRYALLPEFGARPASEIDDREWQTWVDRLSREGLSRSRIANHLNWWSEERHCAGWLIDLHPAMTRADDPAFSWLVEQAGGWWWWPEGADDVAFRPGSVDELRA